MNGEVQRSRAPGPADRGIRDLDVLVVDCQTTGATPGQGQIIELGWMRVPGGGGCDGAGEVRSELVALDGATYPGRIEKITGISEEMLDGARPLEDVWKECCEALAEVDRWVAHYAQFERRFLEAAREQSGAPEHPPSGICTHRLAERLYPGLPRLGLEAVAGFLGRSVEESNRAEPHVRATAAIWREFRRELLEREGVEEPSALRAYLEAPAPDSEGPTYAMDRDRRLSLSDAPGVYRLVDAAGDPLYVGKATSLKRRVNQYFQTRDGLSNSKRELVAQVHDVEIERTETPLEAALVEVDAIKRSDPPYNQVLGPKEDSLTALGADATDLEFGAAPVDRIPLRDSVRVRLFLSLSEAFEPSSTLAHHLRVDEPRAEEVVDRFRATHELGAAPGLERLAALGVELWPRPDRPDDEQPTPRERLASLIRGGARELRLGIWLERLAGASLLWELETADAERRWRRIELDGAQVTGRETVEEAREIREPRLPQEGESATIRSRAAFDRLRVLTTELRRISASGRSLELDLPAGARLRGRSLRALLAFV